MTKKLVLLRDSDLADEQPIITAEGLAPGERAAISLSARDGMGRKWSSQAIFEADNSGRVNTAAAAPLEGSYSGVRADGLLFSLALVKEAGIPEQMYFLPVFLTFGTEPFTVEYTLSAGGAVCCKAEFPVRFRSPEVIETAAPSPYVGKLFTAFQQKKLPSVLVLGGSNGGFMWSEEVAAVLASRGYAAMALSYFDQEGKTPLPNRLERIPLEYFEGALSYLENCGYADGAPAAVMGVSKGGEAALLTASYFPNKVGCAVAVVPSSHAMASCAMGPVTNEPCWTFGGEAVPFVPYRPDAVISMQMTQDDILRLHTDAFELASPEELERARIRVENCRCPILMVSGGKDQTWTSGPMCNENMSVLDAAGYPYEHIHLYYPDAPHTFFLPGISPYVMSPELVRPESFSRENKDAWDKELAFLQKHRPSHRA